MHLNLEELLELRDGEQKPEASLHVAMCPSCSDEVERLRDVAAALQALPQQRPASDRWSAVRAAFLARQRRRRLIQSGGIALALAASLLFFMAAPRTLPPQGDRPAGRAVSSHAELAQLVSESQRLEDLLRKMRPRSRVLDIGEASAAADLEDRISVIDAKLSLPRGGELESGRATALWKERVGLMSELVRAHDTRPAYIGL